MSDTNLGPTTPKESPPGTSARSEAGSAEPRTTGWVGWIVFAGVMMLVLGMFHAFQGLIALFQKDYYLVAENGLTIHLDYTAWGWTHLIFGIVVVAAGAALLVGQMWARVVGVVLAVLSAVVNIGFLAAYPVWSTIMIAVDILVIWALTVHGGEMRTRNEAAQASFR
jgi:tetrahydromethanopterin S-methyltransferase subunit F